MSTRGDEFVHERSLAWCWPEQSTHTLNVLSLAAHATDDHGDVCIRYVNAFIQHPRADQNAQISRAKRSERSIAFSTTDVTRDRHHQVLTGNRIGRLVVRGKDEDAVRSVAREHLRHRLGALHAAIAAQASRVLPLPVGSTAKPCRLVMSHASSAAC
jgi:adenosyl cobinamide kinase/adenosyl cobinamide phosphate guanylyltransferase